MDITITNESTVIHGNDAFDVEPGTILIVHYHTKGDAVGKFIIRTTIEEIPFVTLSDGGVWDNSLENYSFKKVRNANLTIEI